MARFAAPCRGWPLVMTDFVLTTTNTSVSAKTCVSTEVKATPNALPTTSHPNHNRTETNPVSIR